MLSVARHARTIAHNGACKYTCNVRLVPVCLCANLVLAYALCSGSTCARTTARKRAVHVTCFTACGSMTCSCRWAAQKVSWRVCRLSACIMAVLMRPQRLRTSYLPSYEQLCMVCGKRQERASWWSVIGSGGPHNGVSLGLRVWGFAC